MKLGISTQNNGNNGKAMVLSFAETNGHIKYMGYSDGWLHKDCGGTLSANGKPGYFDCRKCGDSFKKQSMLQSQLDTRDERAKALLPTVSLEHRNDKIGLIRFIVRSQSRYLVKRDNHGNWTCGCEDFQVHTKYDDWHCKHILACEYHLEKESKATDEPYDAIAHLETRFRCKVTGVLSAERIRSEGEARSGREGQALSPGFASLLTSGNGSFKVVLSARQKSGLDSTIDTTLDTATLKSLGWTPPKPLRPSLICKGTQKEFETANRLDEAQIAQMKEGCTDGLSRAYLINGKVAISYYGTLKLAETLNIEVSDVQVKQASQGKVATAKATNPKTGVTQCGAHSQPTLLNGLMPDNDAQIKAQGKATRNAILKVIPEVDVYRFANKYAQKPSDDLLCDGTEPMKASTQKKQNGRNTSKKGYWATTLDGNTVWVTEQKRASQRRSCPKCGDNIKGKGIFCSVCVGKMLGRWDGNTVNLPTTNAPVRVPEVKAKPTLLTVIEKEPTNADTRRSRKATPVCRIHIQSIDSLSRWGVYADDSKGNAGEIIKNGFKNPLAAKQWAKREYPQAQIIVWRSI